MKDIFKDISMAIFITLVVFIVALLIGGISSPAQTVLPFTGKGGELTIEVRVNGTPRKFLLDTGAKNTVISRRIVPTGVDSVGGRLEGLGGDGLGSRLGSAELTLSIGPVSNIGRYIVVDLPRMLKDYDGILGTDALVQYAEVIINYRNHTITFAP